MRTLSSKYRAVRPYIIYIYIYICIYLFRNMCNRFFRFMFMMFCKPYVYVVSFKKKKTLWRKKHMIYQTQNPKHYIISRKRLNPKP